MLAWTMGFAWCCFYSARMSLARFEVLQDDMELAMALTLTISFVSFGCIRVLDIIADLDCTGPRVDKTIIEIINAFGLIVGFGWEQTFDQAVESLASASSSPHLAKFVLAVFCVLVIVPAWYQFILPMAITQSWEWGFIVHNLDDEHEQERLKKAFDFLEEKRRIHSLKQNGEHHGAEHDYNKLTGDEAGIIEELREKNRRLELALETCRTLLKESGR